MKRLLLILALLLVAFAAQAQVAYSGNTANSGEASTATITTGSITVSGTNPVLVIGISQPSNTNTVSSVSFTGGGTPGRIIRVTVGTNGFSELWCIPAPPASTGTVSVTFSSSSFGEYAIVALFTGANQTTPCPVGDAKSIGDTATDASQTLTPTNLTASDATVGMVGLFTGGDISTPFVQTSTIYDNLGGTADAEFGYSTGTTGVTGNWQNASGSNKAFTAIRIAAAAASTTTVQNHFRFRNDDGSETTATWAAAEDAAITAALSTTLRLRVQVNTTGDTPTSQKQLEWKKSTDAAYRKVDVAPSQVVYTICASGCTSTTNFVAPNDVFTAVVECYGGGGAGARAAANSTPGGGGKGGSYAKVNAMPLTPGTTYTPTLGAGGVSATPTNGGATDFIGDSSTHCTAAGGVTPAISSLTGATTVNGTSVGDVINLGGNGANGVSTTAGGGGEAGGSAGVGNPGSGSTGGSGAGDGGDGGAGRTVSNGVGTGGTAPGGAGGGALRVSTTSNNGGGGAAGMVRITYTATPAIQLVASANIAAGGGTATTAQLTSPGGSFTAGHISDDTNPLATTDIGAAGYEEDEWAIKSFSPAVNGSIYVFQVTLAGTVLTTYSVTPQWTIGTLGGTVNCTITLMGAGPC